MSLLSSPTRGARPLTKFSVSLHTKKWRGYARIPVLSGSFSFTQQFRALSWMFSIISATVLTTVAFILLLNPSSAISFFVWFIKNLAIAACWTTSSSLVTAAISNSSQSVIFLRGLSWPSSSIHCERARLPAALNLPPRNCQNTYPSLHGQIQ